MEIEVLGRPSCLQANHWLLRLRTPDTWLPAARRIVLARYCVRRGVAAYNPEMDNVTGLERLSKIMAARGLCSRREADRYIEQGLVLVDGARVTTLGTKVRPDQDIRLDVLAETVQKGLATFLLHKPVGVVSAQPEPGYTPAVALLSEDTHWTGDRTGRGFDRRHLEGLAVAGRLDIDSEGLLVLTQDGRVARRLIGEASRVEKEYLVRVRGSLDARGLALLNHGLSLDGQALRPADVRWQNQDELRFVLTQGKKRQIRRMCELVGLKVVRLKRVRVGRVRLGELPYGQWRYLGDNETF